MESSVILQPADVVVAVKLAVWSPPGWTFQSLAEELGLPASSAFRCVKNSAEARLLVVSGAGRSRLYRAHIATLVELLVHGVKYVYPPDRLGLVRGMPTAHAGPPLSERIVAGNEPPPVWPDPEGKVRGEGVTPLHPCVVGASHRDQRFYEAMTLVDALRIGRARERKLAAQLLPKVLRAAA